MTKKYTKFIKISLIFLVAAFLSSGFAPFVFSRSLEIDYPELMEIHPEETSIPLPEYVKYIFGFALWIVGIVAFGVLAFAGIRYLLNVCRKCFNPKGCKESNLFSIDRNNDFTSFRISLERNKSRIANTF